MASRYEVTAGLAVEVSDRLLSVAGEQGRGIDRAFEAAGVSLEAAKALPEALGREPASAVGWAGRAAGRTQRLVSEREDLRGGQPGPLAVWAAREEARALGLELGVIYAPGSTGPGEAVLGLLGDLGVRVDAGERSAVEALERLPGGVASALAEVVEAFRDFRAATLAGIRPEATLMAAAGHGRADLDDAVEGYAQSPGLLMRSLGLDLEGVLAARLRLLTAAFVLEEAVKGLPADRVPPPLRVRGVVSIDLTVTDDTHEQDYLLQVDAGGDDIYLNNAGGSGYRRVCDWPAAPVAAALIDLAGNDRYGDGTRCGVNGGGDQGAGFLFDAMGNDRYLGRELGVNGGGWFGAGFLFDGGGTDQYSGRGGGNGGGDLGTGLLIDAGMGDDVYDAVDADDGFGSNGGGSNGGGQFGGGFLLDGGGNDQYIATSMNTPGVNGSAAGGYGHLLDLGGNDFYSGQVAAAGAGESIVVDLDGDDTYQGSVGKAFAGVSVFVDVEGNDIYGTADPELGVSWSNAFAAYGGVALFLDGAGDDLYQVPGGGGNSAASHAAVSILVDAGGNDRYLLAGVGNSAGLGTSILLDMAGDDLYQTRSGGANASGILGIGILVDADGDDRYMGGGRYVNGIGNLGVGLLRDAAGNDTYHAPHPISNGAGLGGSGTLIDHAGDDHYIGGPPPTNGGAVLGTGLLLDLAGNDHYTDDAGGTGQDCTVLAKGTTGAQLDMPPSDCLRTGGP